ncbi:MAG: TolC family protein [Acidobacteria bacterium]|nr:TolC family protein [Acidobacteriota bacterium]
MPAFWALLPALAFGADAPGPALPPADLGDLLRQAEALSPAIRAAGARLEAARRMPDQAGAPPDPEVSLSYVNDGVSRLTFGETEFSGLSLAWMQEIPYPGKLRLAGEVASHAVERAERDRDGVRFQVRAAVLTAYADLRRLDRTLAVLSEIRDALVFLEQSARRRYEVGEGIQESVLKAQTAILRLEAEMARVSEDRRAVESRLNAAIGRAAGIPIGPAEALPEGRLPGDEEALQEAAVAASPEVGALEAAVRGGEAGVILARLDLKPDFSWSASYQNRGGLDPMVMGSFGVRLPLHRARKQAQAVGQKEAELAAAQHELADLLARTRGSVREMVSRVRRAERLMALSAQGIIPLAASTLESAQASYRSGRIGFLDVLNDLAALLEARIDLAAQESDRLRALAALEPLLAAYLIRTPAGSAGAPLAAGAGGQHGTDR